jgi:SAM-dependent methyltransferase
MQLCRAAYPSARIGNALEIGCGAGTIALVLARRVGRIIATDINPRALTMARMNAAVNGIENVEFRAGDAFSPVASEVFDLVVSQPPFVARPPSARDTAYLFGGLRGHEMSLRLLATMGAHLAPRGRAILLIQWPEYGGPPPEDLARGAIGGDDARVLFLRYPPADLDVHCAMYAAVESGGDSDEYARRVAAWSDHLDRLSIRALQSTLTVVQRDPVAPAWTAAMDVVPDCADSITSAHIDRTIAAHDLASMPAEDLLGAKLRPPEGIVFGKEYTLDEPRSPRIIARLPESSLGQAVDLSEASLLLISLVAEAESVGRAVDDFAARQGLAKDKAVEQMLPAIRQALRLGVLGATVSSRPPRPSCPACS